jgi:hypothetical protein
LSGFTKLTIFRISGLQHLLPAFGEKSLADVTTQEIQALLTAKKQNDLSWWSRSDIRNLLSGLYTKAAEWSIGQGPTP